MTEHKKIVVRKPGEAGGPPHGESGHRVAIPAAQRHAVHITPALTGGPRTRKPMPVELVVGIVVGVVAILALGTGYYFLEKSKREARMEALALAQQRTLAGDALDRFVPYTRRMEKMSIEADACVTQIQEAVLFVTGKRIAAPATMVAAAELQSLAPAADAATPAAPPPGEPETPAPAPERPREPAPPEPAPATPKAAPADPFNDGREAPEGVMPLAELEAMRRGEEAAARPPPPSAAPAAAPAPAPDGFSQRLARSSSRPQEPIVALANETFARFDELAQKAHELSGLAAEARSLKDEADVARTSPEAATRAARVRALADSADVALGAAQAHLDVVKTNTVRIVAMRDQTERDRKAAEAAERKRQAEEEHKALVVKECAEVVQLHADCKGPIRKYDFAQAVLRVEQEMRILRTEEAKADLQLVMQRFKRLQDMKTELIRSLNERPFKWGWGTGAAAKDVVGADEAAVWIPTEKIAWDKVAVPQFLKLVDHYAANPEAKLSVRGSQLFATAILLDELEQKDQIGQRLRQAVDAASFLGDEIRKLMPGAM